MAVAILIKILLKNLSKKADEKFAVNFFKKQPVFYLFTNLSNFLKVFAGMWKGKREI